MSQMPESRKCSAKNSWRPRKPFVISGPAFLTVEDGPEVDHNLRFEHSQSGSGAQGRRWREARDGGWFSYELKLPPAGTQIAVQILYWGRDDGREFDLLVEGTVIATPKLRGGKDDYYSVEYPVTSGLLAGKDKVTIRFQAQPGKAAGPIYDVRVVTVR